MLKRLLHPLLPSLNLRQSLRSSRPSLSLSLNPSLPHPRRPSLLLMSLSLHPLPTVMLSPRFSRRPRSPLRRRPQRLLRPPQLSPHQCRLLLLLPLRLRLLPHRLSLRHPRNLLRHQSRRRGPTLLPLTRTSGVRLSLPTAVARARFRLQVHLSLRAVLRHLYMLPALCARSRWRHLASSRLLCSRRFPLRLPNASSR